MPLYFLVSWVLTFDPRRIPNAFSKTRPIKQQLQAVSGNSR
jgi:hypothetical protein